MKKHPKKVSFIPDDDIAETLRLADRLKLDRDVIINSSIRHGKPADKLWHLWVRVLTTRPSPK